MIVDTLKNIDIYKNLSDDIYQGLLFISKAKDDINTSEYQISGNARAIVSEYQTRECFERGFEAHRHVIDIQYPVIGRERIKWSPIDHMVVHIPYDSLRDRTFYKDPTQITSVDIGNGIFAIMFPYDGHSPQHFITSPELIKKITIKVSI